MLDPKARRFISSKLSDHHISVIDGDRGASYPKAEDLGPNGHCLFLTAKNVGPKGFFFAEKQFIQSAKDAAMGKGRLMRGDIVITTRGTIGNIAWYQENISYENIRVNSGMAIIRNLDGNLETEFLYQYLRSTLIHEQIQKFSFGSAQPQLTIEILKRLELQVPPIAEQRKIAEILRTWDEAIEKLEALRAAKEQQLEGFAARLIHKAQAEPQHLREHLIEVSERNRGQYVDRILSVTNSAGFVLAEDQFAHRIASADISNYKIVRQGQYAYNPSRINVGSIARLDDWPEGALSPMYVVFKLRDTLNSDFFSHWLSSGEARKRIAMAAQGSVRDTVSFSDLGSILRPLPSLEEQRRIARALSAVKMKIGMLRSEIEALTLQKRGLMQKLLTGEWRVQIDHSGKFEPAKEIAHG